MALVKWSNGIDYVSGALNKVKKGQHSHEKMLLATHRVAATENPNCTRIYLREKVQRTTAVTGREYSARARFAAVAALVAARRQDLMNVSTDQAAYLAQKDTAGGKKTMKAYYWKICGDQYDAQHS